MKKEIRRKHNKGTYVTRCNKEGDVYREKGIFEKRGNKKKLARTKNFWRGKVEVENAGCKTLLDPIQEK